jgi:hypothetical protein
MAWAGDASEARARPLRDPDPGQMNLERIGVGEGNALWRQLQGGVSQHRLHPHLIRSRWGDRQARLAGKTPEDGEGEHGHKQATWNRPHGCRLPCEGLIWLGDLSLLNPAGAADVDPYAQHTAFVVLEFGADYGSGGIGSLVQPLIGERVFGTLKPNRQ